MTWEYGAPQDTRSIIPPLLLLSRRKIAPKLSANCAAYQNGPLPPLVHPPGQAVPPVWCPSLLSWPARSYGVSEPLVAPGVRPRWPTTRSLRQREPVKMIPSIARKSFHGSFFVILVPRYYSCVSSGSRPKYRTWALGELVLTGLPLLTEEIGPARSREESIRDTYR